MKKIFSIGEMAKLNKISAQTLRFYDKKGILKPKIVNKDNGYRYYSIEQFEVLDTISYLKYIGMSLEEIQNYLAEKSIENPVNLLEKQIEITERKIKDLTYIKEKIHQKLDKITSCINLNLYNNTETFVKEISERKIISSEMINSNSIMDFLKGMKSVQNILGESSLVFNGSYSVIIPYANLRKGNFDQFSAVYIFVDDDSMDHFTNHNLKFFPAGKYACIYHRGPYEETYKSYTKLIKFIEENELEVVGDAIEIPSIDFTMVHDYNEMLTEIQIPIK